MAMQRRAFLKSGATVAGGAAVLSTGVLGSAVLGTGVARAATGGYYLPNLAPLQPFTYYRLPPGAVTAQGWLSTQLQNQLAGLSGRMQETSHFLDITTSGWTVPANVGWEELPYWIRGYADLGYVTGNATVISTTASWMNKIIATQQSDGFFGPTGLRTSLNGGVDFWPFMPLLRAMVSFQEYTGDTRIVPFLTKFFTYMNSQPVSVFQNGWGYTRWSDCIETIYWVFNHTGSTMLTSLVTKIHQNSAPWASGVQWPHNVNISQGFREPAVYGLLSGGTANRTASYTNYNAVQAQYGQFAGGGFAGDENVRTGYGDPRQGFETCGIVEYMQSHEILTRITGDALWADRTEELAFNMLPASLDPTGKTTHYITSANSIALDNNAKTMGQFNNNWAMQSFQLGIDQYRCCPHNYGMGWPFFTEELWLASPDNGLVASMYAPSTVTAKVADGTSVTFVETTDYPFNDTITFKLTSPKALTFPLRLRIPGWCANPVLKVNGVTVTAAAGPTYVTVSRTWNTGDTVTLQLPMTTRVTTWASNHNAVSVSYGPLTFSLPITENWTSIGGTADWPIWSVQPGSPWNYGLSSTAFTVTKYTGALPANPFTPANAPIKLGAQVQQIPAWTADSQNVITQLQQSPTVSTSPVTTLQLIPMGAARLRMTTIPTIGTGNTWTAGGAGAAYRIANLNSGKVLAVSGMSLADSALVVQFTDNGTVDHNWTLIDNGNGYLRIANVNSGKVLGVDGMSLNDSANVVQFADSGTNDHLWKIIDNGDGWFRIQNDNSGKILAVNNASTADSAQVQQFQDNGTPDHLWRLIPNGAVRVRNANSGKVLGVDGMSTADSANVVQFADSGTADHLWTFVPDANGYFRIKNSNSGKVLAVSGASTANSAQVQQFTDNGASDHLWRLRYSSATNFRLQNLNSGRVLGVSNMSLADSALVVQYDDNGTADHLWTFL